MFIQFRLMCESSMNLKALAPICNMCELVGCFIDGICLGAASLILPLVGGKEVLTLTTVLSCGGFERKFF